MKTHKIHWTYKEILEMYQGNHYQALQYFFAQQDEENKTGLFAENKKEIGA